MKLNDIDRRKMWEDFTKVEFMVRDAKAICQNPIEIINEDLKFHLALIEKIKSKLDSISYDLIEGVK